MFQLARYRHFPTATWGNPDQLANATNAASWNLTSQPNLGSQLWQDSASVKPGHLSFCWRAKSMPVNTQAVGVWEFQPDVFITSESQLFTRDLFALFWNKTVVVSSRGTYLHSPWMKGGASAVPQRHSDPGQASRLAFMSSGLWLVSRLNFMSSVLWLVTAACPFN